MLPTSHLLSFPQNPHTSHPPLYWTAGALTSADLTTSCRDYKIDCNYIHPGAAHDITAKPAPATLPADKISRGQPYSPVVDGYPQNHCLETVTLPASPRHAIWQRSDDPRPLRSLLYIVAHSTWGYCLQSYVYCVTPRSNTGEPKKYSSYLFVVGAFYNSV